MISLGAGLATDPELRADRDAIAATPLRNNFLKNRFPDMEPLPDPGVTAPENH
jgi:hypothetical protein